MNLQKSNILNTFKPFHIQSSTILLVLLSLTDLIFVVLYWFLIWKLLERSEFDLTRDLGFAELYQYIKEFWCIALTGLLFYKSKEKGYLSWMLMFTYILLDDSARIHENLGKVIARNFNFPELWGLRGVDIGELSVFVVAGAVTIGLIIICFKQGSKMFKQITLDLFLFIGLLILFGVVLDGVHVILNIDTLGKILGTLEDYGEMLVITLITWYLFLQNIHPNPRELSLLRALGKIYTTQN